MPHRRCRKSLAVFLSGMMCLFLWQAGIYPVLGQGNENESLTTKVVVKHGETLWNLAQKYHTTISQLVELNQLKSPNQIREGQSLLIPNGSNSGEEIKTTAGSDDNTPKVSRWVNVLRSIPVFAPHIEKSAEKKKVASDIPTYEIIVNQDTELSDKAQTVPVATESQILSRSLGRLVSKDEVELLARVIYGEARGEDFEGQVAVGAVVLNRLKDPRFPKTMRDIVYQAGAFTAVKDKQIHLEPDDQAYKAAEAALSGVDPSNGAIYYYNPRIATDRWIKSRPVIKRIGNHTFSI
ncbi:MAG: cell wall hydrolase [Bacillota bacterium]|nr:cell wall hydrolase [Bacillota bacterium]